MKNIITFFKSRIKSINHAIDGLKIGFGGEINARIHIVASIIVIILGFIFNINTIEWLFILASIGFVISLEIINTAIEHMANFISPDKNESIKKIKDLSAGAVLIAAITALVIGIIIFTPKLTELLQ